MHCRSVLENTTTMLSPYTVLSLAPAPAPAARKLSLAAAAMQLRKEPPSVVALPPWASYASNKESRSCRRAPLFTCHANKYDDLEPNALEASALFSFDGKGAEAPKASTLQAGNSWTIMGDKDVLILKLESPAPKEKEKFKVETAPDQAGLVIKYTDDGGSPASVRLNMPRGYDVSKVQFTWFHDWLLVLVAKPKHDPMVIKPSGQA